MDRINYIDTTKGIGIVIVIWNHICAQYIISNDILTAIRDFTVSFWMPLFFIVSGVFLNNNKDTFKVFIIKRFKSIIIPLLFFYILSFFLSYIATHFFSIKLNNNFEWSNIFALVFSKPFSNGALWFLSALFFSHIMYYIIHNYSRNKYVKLVLILIISVLGYSWNYIFAFRLPFYIDTSMTSLFFLYLGSIILNLSKLPKGLYIKLILLICVGLIVWFMKDFASSMVSNNNNIFYFLPYYLVGFLGTFWVIILSQTISKVKILTYFGEFSIIILCVHYLLITPLKSISSQIFENSTYQILLIFISILIIMYPTIYLVTKYTPFLIGKSYIKK